MIGFKNILVYWFISKFKSKNKRSHIKQSEVCVKNKELNPKLQYKNLAILGLLGAFEWGPKLVPPPLLQI